MAFVAWTGEQGTYSGSIEKIVATEKRYGKLSLRGLKKILSEIDPDIDWSNVVTRTQAICVIADCWGQGMIAGEF